MGESPFPCGYQKMLRELCTSQTYECLEPSGTTLKSLLVWSVKGKAQFTGNTALVMTGSTHQPTLLSAEELHLATAVEQNYRQPQPPFCSNCAGHLHNDAGGGGGYG